MMPSLSLLRLLMLALPLMLPLLPMSP